MKFGIWKAICNIFWMIVLAAAVYGTYYSFTDEGECNHALRLMDKYSPCYKDESCMLDVGELEVYNAAKANADYYCEVEE